MQYQIRTLFLVTTGIAFLLAIVRQYLSTATDPDGILAGGLMLIIGTIVGGVIGTQRGPRLLIQIIGFAFFAGLASGAIDRAQDERTIWAFACMTLGLMWGAYFRTGQVPESPADPAEHPDDEPPIREAPGDRESAT